MATASDFLWARDQRRHRPRQSVLVIPYRTTRSPRPTLEGVRTNMFTRFWGFTEPTQGDPRPRSSPGSVVHYFSQVSRGRMLLEDPQGMYVTSGDYFVSLKHRDHGITDEDDDEALVKAVRQKLLEKASAEIDFTAYTEGDQSVDDGDLLVLMVDRSGTTGSGTVRETLEPVLQLDGIPVRTRPAAFSQAGGGPVIAHELMHTIGSADLYGHIGLGTETWNTPASLLGQPGTMTNPDGMHKILLGWQKPRLVDISTTTTPRRRRLRAQNVSVVAAGDAGGNPVLLFDSARGTKEFFVLEFRTKLANNALPGGYEVGLNEAGLAIWHMERNGTRLKTRPAYVVDLDFPYRDPVATDRGAGTGWLSQTSWTVGSSGAIYGLLATDETAWQRHAAWDAAVPVGPNVTPIPRFTLPSSARSGEGTQQILAGNAGVLYRIRKDGSLWWSRHLGYETGAADWETELSGRTEREVGLGRGWAGFHQVIAGDAGVFYCIKKNGALVWYRHTGFLNGDPTWANNGREKEVGRGRNWHLYPRVLGGHAGILYAITDDGELVWWRHTGWGSGAPTWEGDSGGQPLDFHREVGLGRGWNDFHEVFSSAIGVFYCIKRNGDLVWYRHEGWLRGSKKWANAGREVVLAKRPDGEPSQRFIHWGPNAKLNSRRKGNERVKHAPPINLVAPPDGAHGYKDGFWRSTDGRINLRWYDQTGLDVSIRVLPGPARANTIDVVIEPR